MKADVVNKNYNVGTGFRTSLKELAEKLIQLTGTDLPIQFAPRSQATLVRNRIGDPTLAEKDIGYQAQIDLEVGLRGLISWRKNHKEEVAARRRAAGITD